MSLFGKPAETPPQGLKRQDATISPKGLFGGVGSGASAGTGASFGSTTTAAPPTGGLFGGSTANTGTNSVFGGAA